MRRQTSLLVFIFVFYTSLNVQRVSCSIVKYLYIHVYLSLLIYSGPQIFLSKFFINHWMQLLCFIWNTTNCHLFVHCFNNVLRILFAKNELSLLVPLYTYLYLNKTISDKELSVVNPEISAWWAASVGRGNSDKQSVPCKQQWWIHKLAALSMLIFLFPPAVHCF